MKWKRIAASSAALAALAALGWGGLRLTSAATTGTAAGLPFTRVKRGDVTVAVTARGELQGGNTEMLSAPMVGRSDLAITFLRDPGDYVEAGETVVQFGTTEQEFQLKEAEADLAEAEQQVAQARAESDARDEETRYSLIEARTAVTLAELECRRNPLVAAITAQQNNLALKAAQDRLRQLEQDLSNRQATNLAAIAIQDATRNKASVKASTARQNIERMTLKAKTAGYVNIQQNTDGNFMYWGMQLPALQLGDTVRPGVAVAQIPDLKNWEVVARIGELDRGHLAVGQNVDIAVMAIPGRTFRGRIKEIGGTTGPNWDRRFECKMSLDDPAAELRPGMSAKVVITTGVLKDVLWIPSQALFESDGRTFVYAGTLNGFTPRDVKMVRRSESQVVLTGVPEAQVVALAAPTESQKKAATGGAMKALGQ